MKYLTLVAFTLTLWFPALMQAADPTFTPVEINTVGNPRGYYEFLPSAYYENPSQDFPVVIFFHGLGETGDGMLGDTPPYNEHLQEVLGNGPPMILNTPSHPLHNLFEQNDVIVLSPQYTTWWSQSAIRGFLDFVVSYYRIDPRRIYLTGLSAGSSGVHAFINTDPHADQATAYVVCAVRGKVNEDEGDYLGTRSPYWALVQINASANERGLAEGSANNLAGYFLGTAPTDVRASYPGDGSSTYTASFDSQTGTWGWESGTPVNEDSNIKVTLFPGASHNSWSATYNSANMWSWLFAQQKPTITISSPTDGLLVAEGNSVSLQASAVDADSNSIAGTELIWESDLDGSLGTGASLSISNLSVGIHQISCITTDSLYHIGRSTVMVTVVKSGAYTMQVDFGGSSNSTGSNWNNITDVDAGDNGSFVVNATDSSGQATGVLVEVSDDFYGVQAGVDAGDVFPSTAQIDAFYVNSTDPYGAVLVSGLNPAQTYDFKIFASRSSSGVRTSLYTIHGQTASLEAALNTSNYVTISGVSPTSQGKILIEVERDNHDGLAYLGAFEMTTNGTATNQAPVTNAGSDQAVVLSGSTVVVNLDGSASDDGLPASTLSTLWEVISSPGGSAPSIANANTLQTTVTLDTLGSYTLRLTADDSELTSSDTMVITVSPANTAPSVNAGSDQTVTLSGSTVVVNLNGFASDDGLPASTLTTLWEVISSPGGSAPSIANANSLQTTATLDTVGSYTLRLTADDSELTANDTIVITVEAGSTPPSGATVFSQDFNSSSVLAVYINDTSPDSGQFNTITDASGTNQWSISSGALQITRPGQTSTGASYQRHSGLSPMTFTRVEFDLNVTGTSSYADIASLTLGDWTSEISDSSGGTSASKAFSLIIKARGSGLYYLKLEGSSVSDITTGTAVAVAWYGNISGQSQSYTGPDSNTYTVADGTSDLWINGTLILDDITPNPNYTASEISAFRFHTASNQPVTVSIDNFTVVDQAAEEADDTLYDTLESEGLFGTSIGTNSDGSSRILDTLDWEVIGSGSGLSGTADSFHFEHDGVLGNFAVFARVKDLTSSGSTPRAGIMIRESNAAGARMVALATTTGSNYALIERLTTDGSASETTTTESYAYPDAWLLLERVGDIISIAVSSDGLAYTQIDSTSLSELAATVEVGVFASSGSVGVDADATINDFDLTISPAIFMQDFDSSTNVADYDDVYSPSDNQFNDISTEQYGGAWSIVNGALRLVRPDPTTIADSNEAGSGFMRYTDFDGPPAVLKIEFDLATNNIDQYTDLASFKIGDFTTQADYSSNLPSVSSSFDMTIKAGGTGLFRFRMNSINTGTFAADGSFVHVVWYLNASGSTQGYIGPDDNNYTLDDLCSSLWVGTTLLLGNEPRNTNYGSTNLTDIQFRCTTTQEDATFEFDNFTVSDNL